MGMRASQTFIASFFAVASRNLSQNPPITIQLFDGCTHRGHGCTGQSILPQPTFTTIVRAAPDWATLVDCNLEKVTQAILLQSTIGQFSDVLTHMTIEKKSLSFFRAVHNDDTLRDSGPTTCSWHRANTIH